MTFFVSTVEKLTLMVLRLFHNVYSFSYKKKGCEIVAEKFQIRLVSLQVSNLNRRGSNPPKTMRTFRQECYFECYWCLEQFLMRILVGVIN